MFNELMTDRVTIHSHDGKDYADIPASVQRGKIFVDRADIPIRPGDRISRRTPAGVEEVWVVDDPGFFKGGHGFPDHYQMRVHWIDAAAPLKMPHTVYNVTGPNARINTNSVDASLNVVNQAPAELFSALRDVINTHISDVADRDALLERTTALQAASNTKSFAARYAEFMSVAANHVEILAPFIPALTKLLVGQ
jgi:hypothetical protein